MAKILLVEDDTPLMRLYESALSLEHEVLTAATSSDALRVIETHPLDLIIIDLNLPDAPGSMILKQVEAHYPELKVIVMTGFSHFKQESLPDAVIQVLNKPVTVSMLLRVATTASSSNR